MDQENNSGIVEFRSLMTAIRTESDALKEWISSKKINEEENKILNIFDNAIRTQVFGTLDHLKVYQLYEWRKLAIGGDSEGGTVHAKK